MLQALFPLLPGDLTSAAAALVIAIGILGILFWMTGARFSRYIITLAAVAIGTGVGNALPRWCNWTIDGMGPAIGGAIILGSLAYIFHRANLAFWCGILLATWAALGTWILLAKDQSWNWPAKAGTMLPAYLRQVWELLPPDVAHALPIVCAAAFLIGAVPAMVWPRLGMVLFYSATGTTLVMAAVIQMLSIHRPQVIEQLPSRPLIQLSALLLAVASGAGLQWQMNFRKPRAVKNAE